jgi:hypothetical protein
MRHLISLLVLVVFCGIVRADEYYCMFFATDTMKPNYPHVWGTFVQMKDKKLVKEATISWSPERWSVLDRKKPGYNMTLEESMELSGKMRTCIWGPYQIERDLFERAEEKRRASGNYKMLDAFSRPNGINCIHALTDLTGKRVTTHVRYGKLAGVAVQRHYNRRGLIHSTDDRELVIRELKLDKYNLSRK